MLIRQSVGIWGDNSDFVFIRWLQFDNLGYDKVQGTYAGWTRNSENKLTFRLELIK